MQPNALSLAGEMLGNDYDNQACSIAGALEVVGERWSLLIVRDVFLGLRRFDEIQAAPRHRAQRPADAPARGCSEHGVLEKRLYQERPPRYEYRLTEKGLDLWPTIVALMQWGDRYAAPAGGPAGAARTPRLRRARSTSTASATTCGARLSVRDVRALPGPARRRASAAAAREAAHRRREQPRCAARPAAG